jgi:FHS family L-fucose permease-like MFS transporter
MPPIILAYLFFMWGFVTVFNNAPLPHLRSVTELNNTQTTLLESIGFASPRRGNTAEKRAVRSVHLLGQRMPPSFSQAAAALVADLPASPPTRHSSALRISFA